MACKNLSFYVFFLCILFFYIFSLNHFLKSRLTHHTRVRERKVSHIFMYLFLFTLFFSVVKLNTNFFLFFSFYIGLETLFIAVMFGCAAFVQRHSRYDASSKAIAGSNPSIGY